MAGPAPLDPDRLLACLDRFPEDARTLPSEAYVSPEVFDWELRNFYDGSWVCLGRAALAPEPGDQVAVRCGTEAVLLSRDADGVLHALFNTCRHRGHELLVCGEPVNRNVVRCPYHRWTYDLDGTFKGGPGLAAQKGFDRRDPDHSLVRARTVEWRGWVFVNASGDAPEFERHIGDLDEFMEPYEADRLVVGESHVYDIAANWKVIAENYHECYHCSEIHPELCRVTTPGSGRDYEPSGLVIGGTMELLDHAETMSLDGSSRGTPFRRLRGPRLREVLYVQVWPNLLLSVHPDYVMTHVLQPLSPSSTRVECTWLFPPEARARADFDPSYAADFWDITNREDWAACEAVQRGVSGRGYRQAPFSDQERIVHQAMALVARGYLEGGSPAPFETSTARTEVT